MGNGKDGGGKAFSRVREWDGKHFIVEGVIRRMKRTCNKTCIGVNLVVWKGEKGSSQKGRDEALPRKQFVKKKSETGKRKSRPSSTMHLTNRASLI